MFAGLFFSLAVGLGSGYASVEDAALFDRLQRDLMCLCGCSTTLKSCPHTQCGYATPTRKMIKKWIAKGKRYDEIISLIIEESGEVALAAPMKKGFNIVGYAMPFIVMVAASIVVVFITRKWAIKKKRWKEQTIAIAGGSAHQEPNDPLKRKLIEELNDFES